MTKAYFTRKDFIAIALSLFFSFLFLFVGFCIDGQHLIMSRKNPIFAMANALHFMTINPGSAGIGMLILFAIYIAVFATMIIYERRYAIVNNIKPYSPKMFLVYFLSFLICFSLSYGVGILFQPAYTGENIKLVSLYLGYSLLLTTILFVFLCLLFGGILMFAVNFILVDKPFKFFKGEPIVEEEEVDNDVTDSFDVNSNLNANINGESIQGGVSNMGEGNVVVDKAIELDEAEKVFPGLTKVDLAYSGFENEHHETVEIELDELCNKFRDYLASEKLYYDLDTIRFFISGLATSHFAILEGLSGTGKSSLPRYFAKFINGESLFMPVQAVWRDKTNIIGYFNDFSKTYNETDFLIKLYEANYNPDKLYIFVLDEMNISRVEYYFADLLSVLEYPTDEWYLRLMHLPHNFVAPVKITDGFIKIPDNVYFVGTANKDDSTFTISDKVYDRAITIDFDYRNEPFSVENGETISLSKTKLHSLYNDAINNEDNKLTKEDLAKFNKVSEYVYEQFDITFGNRILNQIETIVPVFIACGGKKEDALDFLMSRKILVKIEGRFEDYVKNALQQLLLLLSDLYGEHTFKRSEKIINNLIRRL